VATASALPLAQQVVSFQLQRLFGRLAVLASRRLRRLKAICSRRQAHFLLVPQRCFLCGLTCELRGRPTAWRAGQAAQNGAKPQRRMTSVTCRWASPLNEWVRRSPSEATERRAPQVVQNGSLPTHKKGVGSHATGPARGICWGQHRSRPKLEAKPRCKSEPERRTNQHKTPQSCCRTSQGSGCQRLTFELRGRPTVGRQARATENERTRPCGPGLVARRWTSP
jgi:hypothetical protein